jgi:hypothetical protein
MGPREESGRLLPRTIPHPVFIVLKSWDDPGTYELLSGEESGPCSVVSGLLRVEGDDLGFGVAVGEVDAGDCDG